MKVTATLLVLVSLAAHARSSAIRCPRAQYPYMQLQVYACAHLQHRPPVIVLDPANYARLRGEMEQCAGHAISGQIKLCGIPVVRGSKKPNGAII